MARAKAAEGEADTSFEPEEEAGGYVATCPGLPGLGTGGDTREEARAIAAGAIRGYLESLRKDSLPLLLGEVHETEPMREAITVVLEPA